MADRPGPILPDDVVVDYGPGWISDREEDHPSFVALQLEALDMTPSETRAELTLFFDRSDAFDDVAHAGIELTHGDLVALKDRITAILNLEQ